MDLFSVYLFVEFFFFFSVFWVLLLLLFLWRGPFEAAMRSNVNPHLTSRSCVDKGHEVGAGAEQNKTKKHLSHKRTSG